MLNTTAAFELPLVTPPVPDKVTGKNRLPDEARVAMTLRLLRGNLPITESMVAQVAYLCTVRRAKLGECLRHHGNVAKALARAFKHASAEDRIAFIRSIGCEKIYALLTQS
jgi:hypothetical protein